MKKLIPDFGVAIEVASGLHQSPVERELARGAPSVGFNCESTHCVRQRIE